MAGLPHGENKISYMFNHTDRIPACDTRTDRQTDGETDISRRHSPRYA